MRVLHIISSLNLGGAEILALNIGVLTNTLPFNFYLVYNRDGVLSDNLKKSSCSYAYIPKKGVNLRYIRRLRNYLIENKIDVVHVHDRVNAINVLSAGVFLKIKYVFTVHGFSFKQSFLACIISNTFNKILYVSETLKKVIVKKQSDKHQVVYNGIDGKRFGANKNSKRIVSPKEKGAPLLGMVGNFKNSARDQLTVCKALKILKEQGIPFQFIFVGEKSETQPQFFDQCHDYCKDNNLLDQVQFPGSRTDIPGFLMSLDLFVYSSHTETFCLSVVEAMMSGTPVITNNLPVFEEITNNGVYATLYQTQDPQDLAKKLVEFSKNPEPFYKKANQAAVYAKENFSIEKHIEQLYKIYQELLHA